MNIIKYLILERDYVGQNYIGWEEEGTQTSRWLSYVT